MSRAARPAFSLVEFVIVIGLIGLIVGLLLPAVQMVRESAARTGCLNNLRQIGLAVHGYHDLHEHFPRVELSMPPRTDKSPTAVLSWMVLILPQMGDEASYEAGEAACRLDLDPLHNPPHTGLATVVRAYVCPDDSRLLAPLTDRDGVEAAFTSYIAIGGGAALGQPFQPGVFEDDQGIRLTFVTDGTSNTIMVGERPPPASLQAGWWYPSYHAWTPGNHGPNTVLYFGGGKLFPHDGCVNGKNTFGPGRVDNPCDRFHLWSLHPAGANFLFADASARFLGYSAEPLMVPLASRSGGEDVVFP
jgi:prepilin-type processing-associated H-X9-DG protein